MKNKNVWRRGSSHPGQAALDMYTLRHHEVMLVLSAACMCVFVLNFVFADGICYCETPAKCCLDVCYPAWQGRWDRPFLTSRLCRSVRKQPGPAGSAMLDRGSHMHLRCTVFSARDMRAGSGQLSNAHLKEGIGKLSCPHVTCKHSRLGFPALETSEQSRDM